MGLKAPLGVQYSDGCVHAYPPPLGLKAPLGVQYW